MNLLGFQGGADHPVQTGILGGLGVVHDHLVNGLVNEQVPLHGLLIGGGQLGHGDEQRPGAVRPGQTLQGGAHHGGGTRGVKIRNVHIQLTQHRHGLLHGVGDVVELQIQENLMASGLQLPDNAGALGIVQLHADFHEGLAPGELVQEGKGCLRAGKIAGYDYVLTHLLYASYNLT